ncbi:MAG: M2 family metallopeptidase [Novosphingobium sp.]|uniref:M2 family metallopeptidase n=1 Tax=Novosphingobium sp. TaxID=1874826 RepID=UPI0032B7F42B
MKRFASLAALATTLLAAPALAEEAASPQAAADAFVAKAEKDFNQVGVEAAQADWVYQTFITQDTEALTARGEAAVTTLMVRNALDAAKHARTANLSYDTARKLDRMRTAIVLPAPTRDGAAQDVATIKARIQGIYGKGKGTLGGQPINGSDIEEKMGTSRNPEELKEMWTSWNDAVGKPMKDDYAKLVALANQGAQELGFSDLGAQWRSNYDMTPEQFGAMTDKLWLEVKPLYDALHTYVRSKLNAKYGDAVQARTGPIRADLLGNMWGQEWGNIYDLVAPPGSGDVGFDVTELLKAKQYDPVKMVKAGEGFFSSLGFEPLPQTFWERSQFTKPQDREVVCHASAWDIDNLDDLRIKMCIKVNGDDFVTIHHELGHNYYQRAYNKQTPLYLDGANDGFHEAIGDAVALSMTPEYLVQIGLLDRAKVPSADKDTGLLLRQAMDKVAFLPFGLLVDRWRWQVFAGQVKPDGYQQAWTDLRLKYQGIVPPAPRGADAFDPGAKYHIPAVVPYTRYFLARILQFQFYEAACRQAGWKGPLHRCSFYGNKTVGKNLNAMLAMGASKPWPDALQAFTGSREISGKAMMAYFAPLKKWLDKQNKGQKSGW